MSVRGVRLYKVTIPEDSADGTTIYECDPMTGALLTDPGTGSTAAAVEAMWFGPLAMAHVYVDSTAWTDAELALKVSYKRSATAADYLAYKNYNGEYDAAGTDTIVIDGIATDAKGDYLAPANWAGAGWARLHSVNASTGADVNQTGADKDIYVLVKG